MKRLLLAAAFCLGTSLAMAETTVLTPEDRTAIEADYNSKINALDLRIKALEDAGNQEPPPPPPPPPPAEAGVFTQFTTNRLIDVAPSSAALGFTAYSGALYDIQRKRIATWGGGHNDYCGREGYFLPIETGTWERVGDPNDPASPVASHTYDGLEYVPTVDKYVRFGGSNCPSGSAPTPIAKLFDPNTNTWTDGARILEDSDTWLTQEAGSGFNPTTGEVIFTYNNGAMAYNVATGSVRRLSSGAYYVGWGKSAAFDTKNQRLVSVKGVGGALSYYSATGGSITKAPVTGNIEFVDLPHCGIAYHTPSNRFAIWCGTLDVWAVDADTWISTKYTGTGATFPTPGGGGIWSRFLYIADQDKFFAWPGADTPAYLYVLPPVGTPGDSANTIILPNLQKVVDASQTSVTLPTGEAAQCFSIKKPLDVTADKLILKRACGDKAAAVISADGVSLRGLTVRDVSNGDNWAAVRLEKPTATIRNLVSLRNDTCVMSSGVVGGTLTLDAISCLDSRGHSQDTGQTHGFYLGYHDRVLASNITVARTGGSGHNVKVRAKTSVFSNFVVSHAGSREFDFPMGGKHVLRDGKIIHGANGNQDIIGIGHEAPGPHPWSEHSLLLENMDITCERKPCVLFSRKGNIPITIRNSRVKGVTIPREYDGGGNTVLQ